MKEFWFVGVKCLEDVKKLYHKLVKEFHPDISKLPDAHQKMVEINNEYEQAFQIWKNTRKTVKEDETVYYQKETNETADEFRDIIEDLIHYPNIVVEIIGTWIWVSGETKAIKEELKKLGFMFSSKKVSWYLHKDEYHKKSKRNFSMDELRNMFESEVIEGKERTKMGSGA